MQVATSANEIAAIVARESAETIVGRNGGFRVGAMRVLLRPAAQLIARRVVDYDRRLGEDGLSRGASVVTADDPFLHALRRANRRFVFVYDTPVSRLGALRRIGTRLRRGRRRAAGPRRCDRA